MTTVEDDAKALLAGNRNGNGNGNGNGKLKWNSCTVVSDHWTRLLDLPILPLLVRADAKRAYLSFLELA